MELVLSAFVGAIMGLALAVLVQPLLEDSARSLLVRVLGQVRLVRARAGVDGEWFFVWCKDGRALSRSEEQTIRIRTVGTKVAGKFDWRGSTYQVIGSRHTGNFISGTYVDEKDGNVFHGAFQLRALPGDRLMEGRWIGFNTAQEIQAGPWHLRRVNEPNYAFEDPRRTSAVPPNESQAPD